MTRKLFVFALGASCLMAAVVEDEPREPVQVTKTEHMDFVPRGTVRLENSFDELVLEGWDRPEVEITTVVSTKDVYGSREREAFKNRLEQFHLSGKRQGDEITLSGVYPRRRGARWLGRGDFYMESRVKVPRGTRLVVRHHAGEVHVSGVTGDIDVRVPRGLIALSLPQEGKYDIDAKGDFGNVISDFPGRAQRRFWLTGHQFLEDNAAGAPKLHLRIGYGDIEILKIDTPAYPVSPGR